MNAYLIQLPVRRDMQPQWEVARHRTCRSCGLAAPTTTRSANTQDKRHHVLVPLTFLLHPPIPAVSIVMANVQLCFAESRYTPFCRLTRFDVKRLAQGKSAAACAQSAALVLVCSKASGRRQHSQMAFSGKFVSVNISSQKSHRLLKVYDLI